MTTTNYHVDDPYDIPFSDTLPPECPEELMFGLLPCLCENAGWLPLADGGYVQCFLCAEPED